MQKKTSYPHHVQNTNIKLLKWYNDVNKIKKKMNLKIYIIRALLVILAPLSANSSLTAQVVKEKQWKPVISGDFEPKFVNKYNNLITMVVLKKDGTVPAIVDGKIQTSPIIMFNEATGKMVDLKNNWKGDPIVMIFKDQIHKMSDSAYIFQSNNRILRAEIKKDSVIYTETFQLEGTSSRVFSCIDKNNIYFCKLVNTEQCIYICNKMGNLIKKRPLNGFKMKINSIKESKGEIFVGYEYSSWGGYDGIGVANVDLNTGNITTMPSPEIENLSGSEIESVLGRLFLKTDPYKYPDVMLFERIDDKWVVIANSDFPFEIKSKLYLNFNKSIGNIFRPTNDTLDQNETGFRELPIDLSKGLGEFLDSTNHSFNPFDSDPLTKILFDQDFINSFYAKNGYDPLVDYVYVYHSGYDDSIVYGIGYGIIAYLGEKTDEVKTSKVDLPKVSIYPNPATDVINVQNLKKETVYTITTVTGQILLSNTTEGKIDISNLSSGLYFLNLTGYKPERFIKQ